jgi:hypothetical protein
MNQIVATTSQLASFLSRVAERRWTWARNSRCKYVTLKIDTRTGAFEILDRDNRQITLEELEHQYSSKSSIEDAVS